MTSDKTTLPLTMETIGQLETGMIRVVISLLMQCQFSSRMKK